MDRFRIANPMVWVVVETVGGQERFVGQQDTAQDVTFIPFFKEKEEAQSGLRLMDRGQGRAYEVQAVRYHELARDAAANGFLLFLVDAAGSVLAQINPRHQASI